MKLSLVFFSVISFFTFFKAYCQWEYVGDSTGIPKYSVLYGALKFQPGTNEPYFLYQNSQINVASEISMKRFDGDEWVYVGDTIISPLILTNDHLDFGFDPLNANIPIVYLSSGQTGEPNYVAKLNGTSWEPLLGLSNYSIRINTNVFNNPVSAPRHFGFDISSTGNPVLGFIDENCINQGFGNSPGNMSVVIHDGSEWKYLGQSCLSPRTAGTVDLEYSLKTNELFGYHKGGEEQSLFDQRRVLVKLNGNQWDSVATIPFNVSNVVGNMKVNPVTGDVYIYDLGYKSGIGSDREFKVYVWDGNSLDSIHGNDELQIGHANWLTAFHPVSGEMYILFKEIDGYNIKKHDGTNWVNTPFSDIKNLTNQSVDFVDMAFHPTSEELFIVRAESGGVVLKRGNNIVGIDNVNASLHNFEIYPNPTNDVLNISGVRTERLMLYDLAGNLLIDKIVDLDRLEIGHLLDGVYVLKIVAGEKMIAKKIIKH